MKIAFIVEGSTERAFLPTLRRCLQAHLEGSMPNIDAKPQNGRIPKEEKLRRLVSNLITLERYDAVIALTDVYTHKDPNKRDFINAEDAKRKMQSWVGDQPKFYPHAAQYDFEAWLLPFWPTIQKLSRHEKNAPNGKPETINHNKSPSYHIEEIFNLGQSRKYSKQRDAAKILEQNDLNISIHQCPELKSLVNSILTICDHSTLP